jgi:DNA-binding transcriptional LysR family regulator
MSMNFGRPPRATFAQLRSFQAVAHLGGVTRAAEALHLTQPTISAQLRELRAGVGVDLLLPQGRGVRLTDAGQALLRTVDEMFAGWRAFEDEIDALQGLLRGSLRIAGVSTTEYFIAQWLKPFSAAHPGIEIDLAVDNRDAVVRRLEQDQDDLAVMMMPPAHLQLQSHVIMENPLVLVGPAGHPWSEGRPRKLAELARQDLLMRELGSGTRQATLEFFARHAMVPRVRMSLGSNEAVKHAVAAGLGLAILSRHALAARPEQEGLAILNVSGLPIHRQWLLVWRTDRRLPRVAAAFVASVAQLHAGVRPSGRSKRSG